MGTADIWMWSFRGNISLTCTTKMTPSRWKASMRICAIISQHWPGGAGVFQESWRIFGRSLTFSSGLTIVSERRKSAIVPFIRGQLCPFHSLTFFNSLFGHSRQFTRHCMRLLSSTFWNMASPNLSSVITVDLTALQRQQLRPRSISTQM